MKAEQQKALTAVRQSQHARHVAGRPYRSLLVPHSSYIRARRQAGATWQEIAAAFARDHGIQIGAAGVQRFFARHAKRKAWPLGMEPDADLTNAAVKAPGEPAAKGNLFGNASRRGKAQAAVPATAEPDKPRPYRSALNPHLTFLREQRAARASWAQIAEALRTRKGVTVTRQAVAEFFGRAQAREQRAAAKQQAGSAAPAPPAPAQASPAFEDDPVSQFLS